MYQESISRYECLNDAFFYNLQYMESYAIAALAVVAVLILLLIVYFFVLRSTNTDALGSILGTVDRTFKAINATIDSLSGSVPRGAGKPMVCPSDKEYGNGLCYPKCQNIDGVPSSSKGPICWQTCPDGFRDDGAFCMKPEGKRVGKIPMKRDCPAGMRDDGTSCWADTYGRGVGRPRDASCPSGYTRGALGALCWKGLQSVPLNYSCNSDEDMDGLRCYPKCKDGYRAAGCCLCEPEGGPGIKKTLMERTYCEDGWNKVAGLCQFGCPAGLGADIGVSCAKKSVGRGVGTPISACPEGHEKDAGLCYPKCETIAAIKAEMKKNPGKKYKGIGPVCWPV